PVKPDATTGKQEETTRSSSKTTETKTSKTKKRKVSGVYLDYRQISLQRGKTRSLKVTVSPSNASNKKVKWTSSNRKVATVTQKGKVKGIKAGTATVTVTARDGSRKKASCKVIVYNPYSSSKNTSSGSSSSSSGSGTNYYYSRTGGQTSTGSSGSSYYTNPNTGNGNSGQTTGPEAAVNREDASASTQAGAWSFDGETYNADSGDASEEADDSLDEETGDDYTDPDEEEDKDEEEDAEETSDLPSWLRILLGLVSTGGIAGSFRLPWAVMKKHLLAILAFRRRG
ncbi:MAG: Ig-like domain-containing protein, partial [Eubacterium sp.]|nr:Ig-like domain-containing protein [Eubacterium sp.]